MPRPVMGRLLPTIAPPPTSSDSIGTGSGRALTRAPASAPTPTPVTIPMSGPSPRTRFCCVSPSPGMSTPAFSASVVAVSSGVDDDGRPRTAMSRYVAALSAVVPAAPAAAPRTTADQNGTTTAPPRRPATTPPYPAPAGRTQPGLGWNALRFQDGDPTSWNGGR